MPPRAVPELAATGHMSAGSANRGGSMKRQLTGVVRRSILLVATSATAAVLAVGVAGATAAGGAAPGSHPAPAVAAPLSQAAVINRWFSQPSARQGELPAVIATLRAVASGAAPRATPGAAGPLAAGVFNH